MSLKPIWEPLHLSRLTFPAASHCTSQPPTLALFQFLEHRSLLYLPSSCIPFPLLIPILPPDPFLSFTFFDLLHVHSIPLFKAQL